MNKLKAATLALALLAPSYASATDTKTFETMRKHYPTEASLFITGAGGAFFWTQVMLKREGAQRQFCVPDKLALNGQNFMEIYDEQFKRLTSAEVESLTPEVEFLLLVGLIETFPCESKPRED